MCNTGKHIGPIRKKRAFPSAKTRIYAFYDRIAFLFVIVKFKLSLHYTPLLALLLYHESQSFGHQNVKKRQHPSPPECHRIYCYLPTVTINLLSSKWYAMSCQHIPQLLVLLSEAVIFRLQSTMFHLLTNTVP